MSSPLPPQPGSPRPILGSAFPPKSRQKKIGDLIRQFFDLKSLGMSRQPSAQPTEVERQIFRVLWGRAASPADSQRTHRRSWQELLHDRQNLSVMFDKNLLKRCCSVRPQLFAVGFIHQCIKFLDLSAECWLKTLLVGFAKTSAMPELLDSNQHRTSKLKRGSQIGFYERRFHSLSGFAQAVSRIDISGPYYRFEFVARLIGDRYDAVSRNQMRR